MAKRILVFFIIFSLLISQSLSFFAPSVNAATSPWTETDWSGQSGTDVDTTTAGQITLEKQEKFSNTDFETDLTGWTASPKTINDSSFAEASGAVASWPLDDTTSTQSYARVVNPADSEGRDVVINGGFDSDTIWTKQTPWSIASGVATANGTDGDLYQDNMPLVIGKSYQVVFTVSSYSGGTIQTLVGSSGSGTTRNADGTYTQTIVAAGSTRFYFRSDNFAGSIDNVSVKQLNIPASSSFTGAELLTDGDMEAGDTSAWSSLSSGVLSKTTVNQHDGDRAMRVTITVGDTIGGASQSINKEVGKKYRVQGWGRGDGVNGKPAIGDVSGNDLWTGTTSTDWQYADVQFISTDSNGLARFSVSGNTATEDYAEWDDVSVTEIPPLSGGNTNGVTVGSTASGHLTNAYTFDGSNDVVNIYSSDLNSVFNPDEGTLVAWAKVSGAGVWSDNTEGNIIRLLADTNNKIRITKTATNVIYWDYGAGGTIETATKNTTTTSWMNLAISWSKSSDEVKVYFNGTQEGSTQTGIGTWVGNLSSVVTIIGASGSSGADSWSGDINDVRLYNRALSSEEITNLYSGTTATRDTGTKYAGTASSKLVSYEGYNGTFVQSVNVGDTNSYQLEAYAYIDGSTAVSDTYAELYYNGSAITTSYTSVGGGWYKLTGTLTGADEARNYGVLVKADKTVYVDDMSLWQFPTSATLTSSIYDSEQASDWGTLTYTATTPSNTSVSVKVRTSNNSSMSGATAFSSCTAVTSASDISSNSCVTDGERYSQYEVTLADTDYLSTPTFSDFSLSFARSAVSVTLDSPGDKTYTSSERPTFRWKVGTGDSSLVSYTLEVDNGSSGDFSVTQIPVSRTTDYEMPKYVAHYEGFSDADETNNYISVYTKSSNEWGDSQNDGLLKEGKRIWTVKGIDPTGVEYSESRTLFVDRTVPNISINQINDASFSSSNFSTTDTTPTIYGKITDSLAAGDGSTATQDENGPKVASGPKQVQIKIEKKQGLLYQPHTIYTLNIAKTYWECDNSEITDNTKQKCNKYYSFTYTPKELLTNGTYKITISGKDKANNSSSEATFTLNVGTFEEIATPEQEEQLQISPTSPPADRSGGAKEEKQLEPEITKPTEPSAFDKAREQITQTFQNIFSTIGNGLSVALNGIKTGVTIAYNGALSVFKTVNSTLAFVEEKQDHATDFVFNQAKYVLVFVGRAIGVGATTLAQTTINALNSLAQSISNGYNNLASGMPGVARTILTAIGSGVSATTHTIASVIQFTTGSVSTLDQNIGRGITNTARGISALASATGKSIASVFENITGSAKNALASVVFGIGEQANNRSGKLGFAIVKIGYVLVNEPTTIYDVKVEIISSTEAKITWKTNHPANGKVNYGLDETYPLDVQSENRVTDHQFTLTNLTPDTEYHFEVMSQNKNYVYDANRRFRTLGE